MSRGLRTVLHSLVADRASIMVLLKSTLAPWGPYTATAMGDDYVVVEGTRKYYLAIDSIAGVWKADPITMINDAEDPT